MTIRTRLAGEARQGGSTSEMMSSVDEAISGVPSVMTLERGEVVLVETPAGVGELKIGDRLEVEIEGIGGAATG